MADAKNGGGSVRRRIVLGLVLTLAFVGCGGQFEVKGDHHTIFVHGGSLLHGERRHALIEGTLVTRNGCVLLEQARGIAQPVVWPSGTSIAGEDPLTLELPSGERLAVGQKVSGGGGYDDPWSDDLEADIPAKCVPETGGVAVFNADDHLTVVE